MRGLVRCHWAPGDLGVYRVAEPVLGGGGGGQLQSLRSSADDQPRADAKLKRRLDELIHQLIATRPPDSVDLLGCLAVANTTAG